MKTTLLAFVLFPFIGSPIDGPQKSSPVKMAVRDEAVSLLVATDTQVFVPVSVKIANGAKTGSALFEVTPTPAWDRQNSDYEYEFTGKPGIYTVVATYGDVVEGRLKLRKLRSTTLISGETPPPQPPPIPPGPGPGPGPQPPPGPTLGPAWAIIVEESANRTVEQAIVLAPTAPWKESIKAKGHSWRIFDQNGLVPNGYVLAASKVGMPALLIVSKTGKLIDSMKLPTTSEGVEAAMKKATGL